MQIIQVDPDSPDISIIQHAATIIRNGGLIAFPTETVYGLGVDGTASDAIRRIYQAKGRPASKPVLVLIDDRIWLDQLTLDISDLAYSLMDSFWPGPLTLTFQAAPQVPKELLGKGTTIGIRHTASPIARALCRYSDCPITAPSANLSGRSDPLTAEEVEKDLGEAVDMILDGGRSSEPKPSTVVDVSKGEPHLIRAGQIPFEEIIEIWETRH